MKNCYFKASLSSKAKTWIEAGASTEAVIVNSKILKRIIHRNFKLGFNDGISNLIVHTFEFLNFY